MVGFMEGFRIIEGDPDPPELLAAAFARVWDCSCITIVPMLLVVVLTVFGKQTRDWLDPPEYRLGLC